MFFLHLSLHMCFWKDKGRHAYIVCIYSHPKHLFWGTVWTFPGFLWSSRGFSRNYSLPIKIQLLSLMYLRAAQPFSSNVKCSTDSYTVIASVMRERALFHLEAFGLWLHSQLIILLPLWYITAGRSLQIAGISSTYLAPSNGIHTCGAFSFLL